MGEILPGPVQEDREITSELCHSQAAERPLGPLSWLLEWLHLFRRKVGLCWPRDRPTQYYRSAGDAVTFDLSMRMAMEGSSWPYKQQTHKLLLTNSSSRPLAASPHLAL